MAGANHSGDGAHQPSPEWWARFTPAELARFHSYSDEHIGIVMLVVWLHGEAEDRGVFLRDVPDAVAFQWIRDLRTSHSATTAWTASFEAALRAAANENYREAGALFRSHFLDTETSMTDAADARVHRERHVRSQETAAETGRANAKYTAQERARWFDIADLKRELWFAAREGRPLSVRNLARSVASKMAEEMPERQEYNGPALASILAALKRGRPPE